MIEARNLCKSYLTGKVSLEVLKGISLRVEDGSFVAVTGPSGAGKSTLLHLLAGLDTPTSGEVLWEERSISDLSDAKRSIFRNRTIGIVFQFYHLLPELTALENVMLPALLRGAGAGARLRRHALGCLERVGIGERAHHRPRELSGGEQQRSAIARAIVNRPRILFCDEPTGNLDYKSGEDVANLLVELNQRDKTGLVLVTHEAELAARAEVTCAMRDGEIVTRTTRKASA